jgi:[acyl-carrier-protein] S-malonyltransferase
MKRCFVYPGQGAQFVGMGKDLYDAYPDTRDLFSTATSAAGFDVAGLVFSGTEEEIKSTDKSQIAITTVNLAARRVLAARGLESSAAAGFSLGEYSALVDAGVLTEADCLELVARRGAIMEQVSRSLDAPDGSPGMAAVMGIDAETIERALSEAAVEGAYLANLNSPVQTVLSGTASGLEAAGPVLKDAGARRVIPLKVSGPFHSPLMDAARVEFRSVLQSVSFSDPTKPVFSNVTGGQVTVGEEFRTLCADQLVYPVRWVAEESCIVEHGCEELLEVGPGEVLSGLWKAYKKVHPEVTAECRAAGTAEAIESL